MQQQFRFSTSGGVNTEEIADNVNGAFIRVMYDKFKDDFFNIKNINYKGIKSKIDNSYNFVIEYWNKNRDIKTAYAELKVNKKDNTCRNPIITFED